VRLRPLACLLVPAVLILAGCGGESSKGGLAAGPKTKTRTAAPAQGAAPSAGSTAQVVMVNIAFKPDHLTAKVGESVQWSNQDGVPHTVKAVKGDHFQSKVLQPGEGFRYQLGRPGVVDYVCTIHPNMKATVRVVK
jgi:plastocyanin